MDSLNRFDRIVAILIQLQSRKVVKAQDLAERFEVSLRTIYRDIRSLEASGIPIIGEAGIGYSIIEGYKLPPIMFTKEEAGSFVAAEKLMKEFIDKKLGAHFESAIYKIKSVLKGKEKDWIDVLDNQIIIHPRPELFNKEIPDALQIFFESLAEKKQVNLNYRSFLNDEPTQRHIEPVGVFYENNYWHILAYCHLRNDYRQFRTDRIVAIERSNIPFELEHGTMDDHRQNYHDVHKNRVIIHVQKDIVKFMKQGRKYYGFVSERDLGEKVEMLFMTPDTDNGIARWFLMFGDVATIIEPERLRQEVLSLIEDVKANLMT